MYQPRLGPLPEVTAPASPEVRAQEIARFRDTLAATLRQLAAREAEWARRGGDEARYIFIAYQAALEDQGLWSGVTGEIDRVGCDAAQALLAATARIAGVLAGVRDAMHQERRCQLEEASGWLWRRLLGRPGPALAEAPPGALVVADDLPPAELLLADPLRVVGVALATADSRLTGVPNPVGIPAAQGITGLADAVRGGQRAWLRVGGESAELCLDPPQAEWEAAAAAAGGRRREALMARTADGEALPFWAAARSLRVAEQALAAGAERALLFPRHPGTPTVPAGCWWALPVAGDLAAPLQAALAVPPASGAAGRAPVAPVVAQLADLAAVPALLARCRKARRPLSGLAVDLGGLYSPSHPGVLRLLQEAAVACRKERLVLAVGGGSAAMRLLPLWLGAGAGAWWGEPADVASLRERAARLSAAACREAFRPLLDATSAAAVESAVERLWMG